MVCKGKPIRKVLREFAAAFKISTPRVAASIKGKCSLNTPRSRSIPIEMKKMLITGISDSLATRKIVEKAKELNPNIYVIAKVRELQEMKHLHHLGADEIIPEEYETSVEIFVRLLEKYLVPRENIEKMVNDLRANGYRRLRIF